MSNDIVVKYKVLYTKDGKKKRKVFSDGFLVIRRPVGTSNSNHHHAVSLQSEEGADLWRTNDKSIDCYRSGEELQRGVYLLQIEEEVAAVATVSSSHDCRGLKATDQQVVDGDKENKVQGGLLSCPSSSSNSFIISSKGPSKFRAPVPLSHQVNCPTKTKIVRKILTDATNTVKTVSFIDEGFWGASDDSDDIVDDDDAMESGPDKDFEAALPSSVSSSSSSSSTGKRVLLPPSGLIELDPQLTTKMRPHQIEGATFLLSRLMDPGPQEGLAEGMLHYTGAILADEMGLGKTLTSIAVLWAFARKEACKSLIVCPCSLLANWTREIKLWLGIKMNPLVVTSGPSAEVTINTFAISRISRYPVLILSYEMFRKYAVTINKVPNLELMICDEGHRLKNVGGTKTIQALAGCKATRRVILSGTPVQNDLQELFAITSFVAPGLLGSLTEFKSRYSNAINQANDVHCSAAAQESGSSAISELQTQLQTIMLRRTQEQVLNSLLPKRTDYVVYCGCTREQELQYRAAAEDIKRSLGICDDLLGMLEGEAEEHDGRVDPGIVLPGLLQLRQLCHSATALPVGLSDGLGGRRQSSVDMRDPKHCSAKLQILQKMIQALRRHAPQEKLVVVSSFTSSLDRIEALAASMGLGSTAVLRLDGKVPVAMRQPLVDRFNRPGDDSFMFLLSAKAGGVGINLIGASRLVQYDIDWNPAVDQQAMSRVWREGQRRPVYIYRLITHGKIEDAILQRQYSKSDLASLVEDAATNSCESVRRHASQQRMSLTSKDVLQLLYPTPQVDERVDVSFSRSDDDDDVKKQSSSQQVLDHILQQTMSELGREVIVAVKCVR